MKFPLMFRWVHNEIVRDLEDRNAKLKVKNDKLLLDLLKSQRNDTPKDPKTGKFTMKK